MVLANFLGSQVSGYDGSMLNGLNILPSYTEYFVLTPATTGLQTASLFIGAALASLISGVLCDRLGRRPTLLYSSIISLIGVALQGSAQNVAMFTIARIVIGFGSAISGIAGAVYLSETMALEWRAWGVGLLNNFY
jgi:MFS family permease